MAAKGYWLGRVTVNDQAAYDEYRKLNAAPFAKFGGRFIVRGGRSERILGMARPHNVVLEFPSYEAALACFHSPEYQAASQHLKRGCDVDLIIIEGYEGEQP
jgi:uncharacterized protein (DUF1330 family)